jgi:Lrp/AsnC family leucine-responsive transcriptional regulator
MDEIDRAIIQLLLRNGRMSQEQLGQAVHLSRPAIHERLKRLEETGVLRGFTALVNWDAIGWPLTAFVWVKASGTSCYDICQNLLHIPFASAILEECHRVAGEWCALLKLRAASSHDLQEVLDWISDQQGVQRIMTTFVLSTVYEGPPLQASPDQDKRDDERRKPV